jgi:hypothetical protein
VKSDERNHPVVVLVSLIGLASWTTYVWVSFH